MASFVKLRRRYGERWQELVSLVSKCRCRWEDATAQRVIGSKVVVSLLGRNRQAAVTANHGPSRWGPRMRHEAGQRLWLICANPSQKHFLLVAAKRHLYSTNISLVQVISRVFRHWQSIATCLTASNHLLVEIGWLSSTNNRSTTVTHSILCRIT